MSAEIGVFTSKPLAASAALRRARIHRWVRRLHLWIGAWGALAAVMFGLSGFILNHRAVLKIPQGEPTEIARFQLPVPGAARASREALRDWLRASQDVNFEIGRGGPPQREERGGPAHWMLTSGNARATTMADYEPGAESLTLRTTVQSPLGIMSRLHKGVGGGIAWILLSDSFALGMLALGVSGLIMWGRGRRPRQMVFSVFGAAVPVIAGIIGAAVL